MSWEARRACLASLRALGYEVGTGSLVGLPGQSVESLVRDILFFQEIDADMVLVMADRINRIFPRGEITIDVPVMLINPLAKRKQYFY